MASGQMNFNMRFTADTSQAQSSIQQLQTSLSQIAMAGSGTGVSKGMSEAAGAAKELSYHLNQAYNATTGNFDLSRLDKSLKTSKTNVSELSSKLLQAGQSGQQAFVQLAQSIAAADRPMVTLSSRMKDFATTMKNTAKWQISSSVLHGFMGAVQQAYGYAQDLNESLNNIRIVTGYNTDQMAAFAEKANKAAKALSTTTTAYTDAALIYYQQGLGDKEIEERTAVTIKMANVSGQAAETVSDQMTAVWNNFYDGSKSLEYYADVMTKLGAATASSSDEIAQGLEKFAAVSESVGLSYEYATAALATVTAETRQSADVVGTAFKTLFARIQGLKLGETLEDGTTFNQYSEALLAVGVNIKDANGELKDMDAILNEMAAVWETLNRDEQVALAQKVAGVRQYNQLMSLMNNWDVMEQNLEFVDMSEGSLQEQQDIYEESWKAASDRVRASMESIYSDLIDDEFFIDLTNGFSSLIDSIDAFIDGFGGVKMIVMSVASILMSTFAHKIPGALENLKANFNVVFKGASAQAQALTQDFNNVINAKLQDPNLNFNKSQEVALTNAKLLNEAKSKMLVIQDKMTGSEKQLAETELSIIGALEQETQQLADQITKRQQEIALLKEEMSYENADDEVYKAYGDQESALAERYAAARQGSPLQEGDTVAKTNEALQKQRALINQVADARKEYISILATGYEQEMAATNGQIEKSSQVLSLYDLMGNKVDEYVKALKKMSHGTGDVEQQKAPFREIAKQISLITGDSCPKLTEAINKALDAKKAEDFKAAIVEVSDALKQGQIEGKNFGKILKQFGQGTYVDKMNKSYKNLNQTTKDLTAKQDALNQKIKQFNPTHVVTGLEKITAVAGGLGQVAMLATSVRSIFQAWNNDDLSFGEKLTTTFMSLSMIVPAAIGAFKSFNGVLGITTAIQEVLTMSTLKNMEAESANLAVMSAEEIAKTKNISLDTAKLVLTQAIISTTMAKIGAKEGLTAAQAAETIATMAGMNAESAKLIVDKVSNGMTIAQAMAEVGLTGARTSGKIATIAQTVAQWALNASMAPTLALTLGIAAALGTLILGFVGVIAVIGLAVAGFKALSNAYNADAIAAEKAAKTAEELGKMYDEAASKYQNMIDTMSQYKEAQKSLGALTKGTEEYKEALDKANRAALDLIKNNPGQFQQGVDYEWNDETGALEFKDGVLEQAKTKAANRESAAYSAKILGEAKNDQAQAVADKTDFSRDFRGAHGVGDGDLVARGIVNAITASMGIALAPLTNGLSLIPTAAAFIDTANADEKASEFDTAVSKVVDAYQSNQNVLSGDLAAFTSQMNELGIIDSEVINALYDSRDELENLGTQTKNAADQYRLATEAAVRELLGDNKIVQNSNNKNEVISKSADILDKEYQAELNKLEADGWGTKGISQATGVNETARDVWSDYVEAAGLKGISLSNTTGTDDNRIFEYIDAEGETKQVTLEAMKEIVATSKANEKTNETATKLTQVVDTLDTVIKAATDGGENQATVTGLEGIKTGLLSGDFTDFSGAELSTLMGVDPEAYIQQLFGPEYETILQELGFKNAKEYINTFSEGLTNAKGILEEALASLGESSPLVGLAENASAAAVQSIASQSQRAEGLKEGGGAEFESNINSIIGTVDSADQGTAFEALANIDWSQLSAPEEAIEALGRLGISSKETEEKIIELTGSMRELNGANLNDLNTALDSDIDATEYENLAKHIQDVADETDDLSDDLKYNEKAAKKTAEAILRFDKAIQKVDENYDDWKHTLDSGSLQDQAEVVGELKDAYADMLDIDMDSLSDDFVKNADNLELMKKAANGSEEAYRELQQLAGEDILMQIGLDKSQYETDLADINALALEAEGLGLADIEAGASLNNEDFLNGLTEIVNQAGMTAQEATDYLASMGVDAEIEEVESTSTDTANFGGAAPVFEWQEKTFNIPILGEQTIKIPKINWKAFTVPSESEKTTTATGIKVTSANKSSGGGIKHKHSKSGGGTGGAGKKSGGGSTPKPAETVKKTKKSDVVDRYKEVTDSLDENTRALDKANKKADQLYGPGRIKQLQKANKLIKEQNILLKQQQTEAKKNLTNDKNDLNAAAKAAGLSFSYDSSGNITNYTTEMEKLFNELAQAENTMNSFSTKDQQDKFKESTLQPIQDKIDTLKEALAQYEETRELIQDLQEQYEDNLVQLFNNDLEIVTIAVELNLDAAEAGLEWIEYQLKKIEDQAYSTAEAIALLTDQIPELEDRQEINEWRKEKTLATLVEHGYFSEKDVENFNKGNMNAIDWSKIPESAMNELLTYREELYSINEAYMELRDTINGSVIEAFEEWSEEMHDQMELFDYYDSVITSYQNIADLGGKRLGITDEDLIAYEQERVNNANNRLAGSKSYYDQTKTHRDDIANQLAEAEKRYKDYEAAGDTDGMEAEAINIKAWKETLKTAEEELRDAETTYLEDWQSALEASRDAFLKETEIELKALEEQMAGTYGTIEEMQKEFDRKSEINERYLQDYERIYELSKLNRDLTKKMDETSNVKAKQELAKLQEEILEYQEEGRKISQYDLEYLQKRYDLKLAEIAMEEAQNAKTQVRLTRDSEGNYSYTYTADEDSMADSQQSYEDKLYAITDLSNKHIEEQTALLLQTQQEYLDELALIHEKAANGQYETTKEYQKALDDCTAYYTEKMRYHGGEIDKATNRNAVIYKDDYETYERYTGKKLTEAQKLQAQMDADILAAKAKVEELQIEKQAALDEVHRLHAEGYYASEEEYQDALARVEEQYSGRIDRATEKVNTSVTNREKLYGKDAKAYSLESAKKEAAEAGVIQGVEKLLPRWDKAQGSMTNYVKDMTDKIGNAEKGTGYLGQAVKSYGALETNIDTTMKNAGSSIKGFKDDIKKKLITDTDSVKKQSEKTAESIKTVGDASKSLSKTIKDVTSWQKDYSKQIQLAINKNEAFIKSINDAQKAAAKQAKKAVEEKKEPDKPTTPPPSSGGNKNSGDGVAKVGDEVTYVSGLYYYDSLGTAPAGNRGQGKKATITQIKSGAPYPIHLYSTDSAYGWVKKSQISGYDTGGYTGNWGSEGKLAMLHEKELVLNKQDTENMLKIISMVRDLSNVLDMQAYQASLAQLQASHLYHVNSSGETFEQTVTIHAEFPEAIYANEIEAALNNLVNSASQFANRKY